DGKRGADAKLHAHLFGHVEHPEHFIEHRHDHRAAADAEQAGKEPGDHAANHNGGHKPGDFDPADAKDHVVPLPRALACAPRWHNPPCITAEREESPRHIAAMMSGMGWFATTAGAAPR